jgi:hypothetical protein
MKSVTVAIVIILEIVSARDNKMATPYNPDVDLTTVSKAARIKCNFRKKGLLGIIYQFNFITLVNGNTNVIQGVSRGVYTT